MKRDRYRCSVCGYESGRWTGFCPQCRESGTVGPDIGRRPQRVIARPVTAVGASDAPRVATGVTEVDRVLGGGLVAGGAVLVGGEPGVGKSTLLLQVAGSVARSGSPVLVVSAEESAGQVALRAKRIGADVDRLQVLPSGDVDHAIAVAVEMRPALVVVDSIQTVAASDVAGSPGGVAQVREAGNRLVALAKEHSVPTILVGHVTKEGAIAGPRVLEHIVDVVLYLEGDDGFGLRFLRGLKNRFGPVHQIGFFEMGEQGLRDVPDPTEVLLSGWSGDVPGSVVFPAVEGRRPVLVEVQALVAPAATTPARRSARGFDVTRLHQLLAVLDRHVGADLAGHDVYVSVVGGIRVREPAIDLAVAAAVMSSHLARPVERTALWGEVGLTGELRPSAQSARRRQEADRLGFARIVEPNGSPVRIADALATVGLLVPRALQTA